MSLPTTKIALSRVAAISGGVAACRISEAVAPLVLTAIGLWSLRMWARRLLAGERRFEALTSVVFLVHVALAAALFAISRFELPIFSQLQLPGGFWAFTPDSVGYHFRALITLDTLKEGGQLSPLTPTKAYEILVAAIYFAFGSMPLTAIVLNCWLITGTGLLAVMLAQRWQASRPACYVVLLVVSCWPSGFIWSSQLLRDCLGWFLIFGVLVSAARVFERSKGLGPSLLGTALLLLCTMALSMIRTYGGWLMVAASIAALIWLSVRRSITLRAFSRSIGVTVLLLVGSVLGTMSIGMPDEPTPLPSHLGARPPVVRGTGLNLIPTLIEQKRREFLIGSNASIGADADLGTWRGLATFLPVGFSAALLAPFPWDLSPGKSTGILKTLALTEGITLLLMLPVLLTGGLRAARSSYASAVFVFAYGVGTTIFFGLLIPNLGGLVRLRPQGLLPLLVLTIAFRGGDAYVHIARFATVITRQKRIPQPSQ